MYIMDKLDSKLESIAQEHAGMSTLEERGNDSLDFQEVSVWEMRRALRAAYVAGFKAATTSKDKQWAQGRDSWDQ